MFGKRQTCSRTAEMNLKQPLKTCAKDKVALGLLK